MPATLDASSITKTVELLERRIGERFPKKNLGGICGQLHAISRDAQTRSRAIGRPMWSLRMFVFGIVLAATAVLAWLVVEAKFPEQPLGTIELLPVVDAAFNTLVVIGAALVFLFTIERRVKRRRCLAALHELRSLAHIIDMHQLTKDPERLLRAKSGRNTKSSPVPMMTAFELSRYLDYCTEMLSLLGKVAALYVQDFDDEAAVDAVNDIEQLTTGLSRKIWQKLIMLQEITSKSGESTTPLVG